jgi:hypothetical protein
MVIHSFGGRGGGTPSAFNFFAIDFNAIPPANSSPIAGIFGGG